MEEKDNHRAIATAKRKLAALIALEKEAAQDGVFVFSTPPELDFANLKLTQLPDEISQLVYVQKILLEFNNLSTLPDCIGTMQMLEWLVVDSNMLTSIPPSIQGLQKLKWLTLTNNKISKLPAEIGLLASLHTLQLDDNVLETLPPEIDQLSQLRTLSVQNNKLTCLPVELAKLANLRELHVKGNPLRTPPKSIVARGTRDIIGFLKDLQCGAEPSNRCKLMFIGQENVGKTTLMGRLTGKGRPKATAIFGKGSSANISTDGIDLNLWVCDVEGEGGKQKICFSVWDFAGQEIYYTTHQFFLSEKAVYVIVWDLRKPLAESRVQYWIQSIYTRVGAEVPILLVGTHLDDPVVAQSDLEELKTTIKATLGRTIKHLAFVSCQNGEGIRELKRDLCGIANKLKFVHSEVPSSYSSLEALVTEERRGKEPPIMSWSQLVALGHMCNIHSDDVLERAVAYLHQMGSLLYFNENPSRVLNKPTQRTGIADLVILDPQWLTTFMASVITTKHNYARTGTVDKSQLSQRPPMYPAKLHPELISLLQVFDIAFQMPEALDPHWPETTPPKTYQLMRSYKFEFMPNGLFSRISVRILHFTDVLIQWRSGTLFRLKNNQLALVEFIESLNEIRITARGPELPSEILRVACETADSIVSRWFSINLNIYVHCTHCLLNQASTPKVFSMLDCQRAAARSDKTMKCNTEDVSLELLVPDLVLADLKSSSIDFEKDLKIVRQIGKGSFGIIYLATLRDTEQVAVKKIVIPPALEDDDHMITYFEEFRREVWLMSGLNHPNIVNLRGFSLTPLTIVMELVPCGSLESFLGGNAKSTITWDHRIRIAVDIALGMHFLHNLSPPVIHRDLKSPNVLLSSLDPHSNGPIAKVADFGASLRLFADALRDRVIDQARWLAPEIFKKQPTTLKSDVYSFGIILWELLTLSVPFGEYPFARWGSQLEEAIITLDIRPSFPPDAPPNYKALVEQCWAADPTVRPNFDQVLRSLGELQKELAPDLVLPSNEFVEGAREPTSEHRPAHTEPTSPSWHTARFGQFSVDAQRHFAHKPVYPSYATLTKTRNILIPASRTVSADGLSLSPSSSFLLRSSSSYTGLSTSPSSPPSNFGTLRRNATGLGGHRDKNVN